MGMRGATLVAKFALSLFIVRFLSLETLGTYGLITATAVVMPVLTGLGLMNIICRNAVTQSVAEVVSDLRRYWRIQACIYAFALVASAAAGLFWGHPVLAAVIVGIVALEHVNGDLFVLLNHRQQPGLANALMAVRTAGWIFAFMGLALLFPPLRSLPWLLALWAAGCVVAIGCFAWSTRHWPWREGLTSTGRPQSVLALFSTSRTIYLNDIANAASQYVDRYLVGLFMGLELTGAYVLFWSMGNALSNLVSTGVLQVRQPILISSHSERPHLHRAQLGGLHTESVLISLVLAGAAAAIVYAAIPLLNRPILSEWMAILWLVLIGFVLRISYEVQGIGLYSRHQDRLTLRSALFVLGTSLVANVVLMPVLGLYGAGLAIILSYALGIAVRYRYNAQVR